MSKNAESHADFKYFFICCNFFFRLILYFHVLQTSKTNAAKTVLKREKKIFCNCVQNSILHISQVLHLLKKKSKSLHPNV
jgi:hypothetical protein